MAATDGLKEELNCSICLNVYSDPVVVDCGHNFCRECIEQAWRAPATDGTYRCPDCRTRFCQKPELKKNFKLRSIVESFLAQGKPTMEIVCDFCLETPLPAVKTCMVCEASLCALHLRKHNEKPSQRNHVLMEPTGSLEERKCPAHNLPLEYHCCDDDSCACVTCYVAGSHKGHTIKPLTEACSEKRQSLSGVIQKLCATDTAMGKALIDLKVAENKLKKNRSSLVKQVSDLFAEIISQVKQEETRILALLGSDAGAELSQLHSLAADTAEKRAITKQLIKDIQQLRDQRDAFLFIEGFKVSQDCLSKHYLTITEVQFREKELDGSVVSTIQRAADEYIKRIASRIQKGIWCEDENSLNAGARSSPGKFFRIVPQQCEAALQTRDRDVQLEEDFGEPASLTMDYGCSVGMRISNYQKTISCISSCGSTRTEFPQIFCYESFASGRHYWDIDTRNGYSWDIGVAIDSSVTGRPSYHYISQQGQTQRLVNRQLSVSSDGQLINLKRIAKGLTRIRVRLDYDGGTLSFYEVNDPGTSDRKTQYTQKNQGAWGLRKEVGLDQKSCFADAFNTVTLLHTVATEFDGSATPAFAIRGGSLTLL